MWLVLCDENDRSALWAYEGLRSRNVERVDLITSRDIQNGFRLVYRAGTKSTNVLLRKADGQVIDSRFVKGGLNRLQGVAPAFIRRFAEEDRLYVQQESYSALLGWLSALTPNLINRPTPLGLAGQWRPESEWIWLAGRSGLPVRPYRETTSSQGDVPVPVSFRSPGSRSGGTIFVVAGECVSGVAAPADLLDGCVRLAQSAGTELLGVDFTADVDGSWWFTGASPVPDLESGGEPLLDSLAAALHKT